MNNPVEMALAPQPAGPDLEQIVQERVAQRLKEIEMQNEEKNAQAQQKIADQEQLTQTVGKMTQVMQKIEAMEEHIAQNLNAHNVEILKSLAIKGCQMSPSDMVRAADALAAVQIDLQKIGKQKIAAGLATRVDIQRMSAKERHQYEACNMAETVRKQRNQQINKIREKMGRF